MVTLPSESRGRKETYPAPWGGKELPKAVLGPGLALGYDTFHSITFTNSVIP